MPRQDQRYVTNLCDEVLGFQASREHTFDWLRGDPYLADPLGKKLPVYAFWESFELVVEFNERQHSESVAHFDKPDVLTISGVPRGGPNGQRRRYEVRRDELIPAHGLRLIRIYTSQFVVRRHHIVPSAPDDLEIVKRALGI